MIAEKRTLFFSFLFQLMQQNSAQWTHLMTKFKVVSSLFTFWYAGLESMALYQRLILG